MAPTATLIDPRDDRRAPLGHALLGCVEWLASDECHDTDDAGLVAGLGRRLLAVGLPVDRLALHLRTLHPELLGRTVAWSPNSSVEVFDRAHGIEISADFVHSPVQFAMEHNEPLDVRLDRREARNWTLIDVYRERGLVDMMVRPLNTGDGPLSAVTFCTARRGGFTATERLALERIVPALRNLCELRTLRKVELTLLDTYVGPVTAQRILAGRIRRGQVETLEAALMLCDLRGFTDLSNRLPAPRVIALLNDYFDQVVPAITEAGGEIVKFMGDAVLAFFHDDDAKAACATAFRVALTVLDNIDRRTGAEKLEAGIALHYGAVSYGNIGSGRRMDFTMIGPDVNLISRIQSVCGAGFYQLLGSPRFADMAPEARPVSAGLHRLKGFHEPVELFHFEGDDESSVSRDR